ncbi:hypothetical protein KC343_g12585 [Hortaea werneckii]|uniref:Amidohydrolase-related domain-containing protein n=1 Tax=Hortaea werneckii TaxID=91943 RepID=A0A3M7F5C2_HORWE|nr:hypothetical protein KC352_g27165 [Hortaea werneckii]KAI7564367.1 hypothetical protein KC317_g7110 [Hortaea werneckii]KAI7608743.1 hypothetical protein KC343_g12585 [Hortaea werneckii]KAI7622813.1 hypothetical protein KC346_g3030 [Hortaea werneckii]KAI7645142.1 hypothetical protein KC319_g12109 [Hortaea werneckii]
MRLSPLAFLGFVSYAGAANITHNVITAARSDGINLFSLSFASAALASIEELYVYASNLSIPEKVQSGSRVDVHAHVVPPWYRAAVPFTAQSPTPEWSIDKQLEFMANNSIRNSVLSISAPGSTVFPGSEEKSVALARLLNEYLAVLAKVAPKQFSFFAVVPLPYTDAAIAEAKYATRVLGAAGMGLLSNHEGYYLGNRSFTPLFQFLDESPEGRKSIFVHPNAPCLHTVNGSLVDANPTPYPAGLVELYFETARTFMDLTISRTMANFTHLHWIVPHAGGAFPSIEDRFITPQSEDVIALSKAAYSTRFWWDAAGPVFPHQVLGLLGYGVPSSQLLYGSDFPYAPPFSYAYEIAAIQNASFLDLAEKRSLFDGNAAKALGS